MVQTLKFKLKSLYRARLIAIFECQSIFLQLINWYNTLGIWSHSNNTKKVSHNIWMTVTEKAEEAWKFSYGGDIWVILSSLYCPFSSSTLLTSKALRNWKISIKALSKWLWKLTMITKWLIAIIIISFLTLLRIIFAIKISKNNQD